MNRAGAGLRDGSPAFEVTGLAAARPAHGAAGQALALPLLASMAVLPFLVRR